LNAPGVIKSVLSGGGFNWVLVDAEHGQITDSDYYVVRLTLTDPIHLRST
jgi:4-hydroxy-2-oxoheptanedioate aldolase